MRKRHQPLSKMHAELLLIKALRSEESLTSVEAHQFEPDNCFNEDCLFPLGPSCEDCVAAAIAREELRQQLLEAKRSTRFAEDSDDGQRNMRPTNEKVKADELSGNFEFDTKYGVDTNVLTPPVVKPNSLLNPARSTVRTLKSTQSIRTLKSTRSQASSLKTPYHSDSDSSDDTIIYTSENESTKSPTRTAPTTPTAPTTSYPNTTTSHRAQSILEDGEPEVPRRPLKSSSSKFLRPRSKTPDRKVEDWLFTQTENVGPSDKPSPVVPTYADIKNRSKRGEKCLKRTTDGGIDPSQVYDDYIPAGTPRQGLSLPERTPFSACPLCSHPIGDPRDQHLLRCQYAHDEQGMLERSRKSAEARGQPWL
ncbi:hypothetical protein BJ875DRAFT_543800 [Amylocarpus encephaloides]|uniref:Uncharacterized protein n=1 Tax=Amylocarpus encephaloides TaxID=45428 RepID=A0A9P7YGE7_9HELO|nr:hypothetical protein BJ875DRAFT_543800 [Amylocarpus encephaloides]